MQTQESSVRVANGITLELMQFICVNMGNRSAEWPPLIARVRTAMEHGAAPDAPVAQAMARHWVDLSRFFAGDDTGTPAKIRAALINGPGLTDFGHVDAAMRDYIRAAMTALRPQ